MSDRPRSVLIVDCDNLADGLRSAGASLDFTVQTATGSADGIALIEREPVDLVLAALREPALDAMQLMDWVAATGRSISFIVLAEALSHETKAMLRARGVFTTLQEPVDLQDVQRLVTAELSARRAKLEGIPLVAFLQMVAMDRSTGVITVRSRGRFGWLAVDGGDLVGASLEELDGERAAHALVGLTDAKIDMVEREFIVETDCRVSLSGVILEALRLRDERERGGRWRSSLPASRELGDDFEVEFDVVRTSRPPSNPEVSPRTFEDSSPTLLTWPRRDGVSGSPLSRLSFRPSFDSSAAPPSQRVARDRYATIQHTLDGLVVSRAHGLVSAEVWSAFDGTPIAWHGASAASSAVFDRMMSALSEALDESGFGAIGRYVLVDLDEDRLALALNLGDCRAGFVFDKREAQVPSLLSLITVELVSAFQEQLARQTA